MITPDKHNPEHITIMEETAAKIESAIVSLAKEPRITNGHLVNRFVETFFPDKTTDTRFHFAIGMFVQFMENKAITEFENLVRTELSGMVGAPKPGFDA